MRTTFSADPIRYDRASPLGSRTAVGTIGPSGGTGATLAHDLRGGQRPRLIPFRSFEKTCAAGASGRVKFEVVVAAGIQANLIGGREV